MLSWSNSGQNVFISILFRSPKVLFTSRRLMGRPS